MTIQLTGGVDFDGLPGALERVKGWLEANREIPALTKTDENSYRLEVDLSKFSRNERALSSGSSGTSRSRSSRSREGWTFDTVSTRTPNK